MRESNLPRFNRNLQMIIILIMNKYIKLTLEKYMAYQTFKKIVESLVFFRKICSFIKYIRSKTFNIKRVETTFLKTISDFVETFPL